METQNANATPRGWDRIDGEATIADRVRTAYALDWQSLEVASGRRLDEFVATPSQVWNLLATGRPTLATQERAAIVWYQARIGHESGDSRPWERVSCCESCAVSVGPLQLVTGRSNDVWHVAVGTADPRDTSAEDAEAVLQDARCVICGGYTPIDRTALGNGWYPVASLDLTSYGADPGTVLGPGWLVAVEDSVAWMRLMYDACHAWELYAEQFIQLAPVREALSALVTTANGSANWSYTKNRELFPGWSQLYLAGPQRVVDALAGAWNAVAALERWFLETGFLSASESDAQPVAHAVYDLGVLSADASDPWEVVDDSVLQTCCGYPVEWDCPKCPGCGSANPMRVLGII